MESECHELLKRTVAKEMEHEGCEVYVEPPSSPLERVTWSFYRPDILAIAYNETALKVTLVECETNPGLKRMNAKTSRIRQTFAMQKLLDRETRLPLNQSLMNHVPQKRRQSYIRKIC